MALYEITPEQLTKIPQTSFDQTGLRERTDLQRLLKNQIDAVLPGTLIIAEEFSDWDESRRRIDLLGIDKDANLVVIELKRTEDGGHMELQAVRYAAMVSKMTFERAAGIFSFYLRQNRDDSDAQSRLLEFLDWDEPNEDSFAQDVKIVLVSANFSKEITTAVMWLNERDLDIRCIRVVPYRLDERVLLDVQQVIPLPEAAEYQIQIKNKEQKERRERNERLPQLFKFWEGLLSIAREKSGLHDNVEPVQRDAICVKNIKGLRFHHVINQYDGRVEFYITRSDIETNKMIFDQFLEHRGEIDTAFGEPLSWERLDTKKTCRIACYFKEGGHKRDESQWTQIQTEMVDAMIRLEKAISPFIVRLNLTK
jgi:hypothetical protein